MLQGSSIGGMMLSKFIDFLRRLFCLQSCTHGRVDTLLNAVRLRVIDLLHEKGNTVICTYCGQLMPKDGAVVVYVFETDSLEFAHKECFEKHNSKIAGKKVW